MIPKINGVVEEAKNRYYIFKDAIKINYGEFERWTVDAYLERTGLKLTNETGEDISIVCNKKLRDEEYIIDVEQDKIKITASNNVGVIWALTTLYQIMLKDEEGVSRVKCGHIEDYPRYGHRGLSVDVVRHFFSIGELKKIIEEISLVKMNVLHLQLSNDQGFRFESKKYPKLNAIDNKYYRQEELKDLVKYAKDRNITVIPEVNMPGHTLAILVAYPKLSCTGEKVEMDYSTGIHSKVMCPGKSQVYDFVENLLDEICNVFPSERIHIGGDETPTVEWCKCPDCQKKMKELGITEERRLQGYFTYRVIEILNKKGRKIICWNDSLISVDNSFKNINLVQYWSVQYAEESQKYMELGKSMIYSDMFQLYLDYPCSMISLKKCYMFVPEIRKKDYSDCNGLAGFEACIWTEHIDNVEGLETRIFPRLYAIAEKCWTKNLDYEDFVVRLNKYISDDRRLVLTRTIEQANPTGMEKMKSVKNYMQNIKSGMSDETLKTTMEHTNPGEEFQQRFMEQFFKSEY